MSEKRFVLKFDTQENEYFIRDNFEEEEELGSYTLKWGVRKLNEQSDTIEGLILDRNRQEEKLDIARRNLSKQLEKIEELEEENEQLKRELHMRKMSATIDLMAKRR